MSTIARFVLCALLACVLCSTRALAQEDEPREPAEAELDWNDEPTPSATQASTQPTSQPSTQPTTQPARPLIQARADEVFTNALTGGWVCDAGVGTLFLSFKTDGRFRLDRQTGTFRVRENHIELTMPSGHARYAFRFDNKLLVLTGGDLRQELRFARQTNVNDALSGLFEFSAGSAKRKTSRILLALSIMVAARLVVALLQGLSHLAVNTTRGPIALLYRTGKARSRTVHSLILNAAKYFLYLTSIGFIFGELGINYTTYIASLSVIGLAIGFGSQGLVQDTVTGFFIILEGQFDVGDMVEVSGQNGIVLEFGLRSTTILNYLGQVIVIPNRMITLVSRFRLNSQLALVDVRLASTDAAAPATQILSQIGHELNVQFSGVLKGDPEPPKVITLATGEVFLRTALLFWPGQNWIVETQFVPRVKEALKAASIEVPGDQVILFYHPHDEARALDWREYLHFGVTKPGETGASA